MKSAKITALLLIALTCILMSACKNKNVNSKEINIKLDTLSVNGKSIIEQDVAKEAGVFFVKAHLRKKIVTIVYDTTLQNISQLMGLLEKKGYKTELTQPPVPE